MTNICMCVHVGVGMYVHTYVWVDVLVWQALVSGGCWRTGIIFVIFETGFLIEPRVQFSETGQPASYRLLVVSPAQVLRLYEYVLPRINTCFCWDALYWRWII